MVGQPVKIAVVGDVHNQWSASDHSALKGLGVDLVLFVGDFGNEALDVVQQIAALDLPKAVIFGNHDAWYTATSWGREKCPYDRSLEDRVQAQQEILGTAYVGYGKLDLPDLGLSVVGVRPFSWGGPAWRNRTFYKERFGVTDFESSVDRILQAIGQTAYDDLILIGHNGPSGLGSAPEDPCGKDWYPVGGDYGDPDFETAISKASQLGKRVMLATFGHMHHHLRHRKDRTRRVIHRSKETVYLNAACVPRVLRPEATQWHQFSLVTLVAHQVEACESVWVTAAGEIVESTPLYPPVA